MAISGRGAERAAVVFRSRDAAREFQRRNPWFGSSDLGTLENLIELEQHRGKLKRSAFTHILVDPGPVGRELEFSPSKTSLADGECWIGEESDRTAAEGLGRGAASTRRITGRKRALGILPGR
jgi:hypothetical protein